LVKHFIIVLRRVTILYQTEEYFLIQVGFYIGIVEPVSK